MAQVTSDKIKELRELTSAGVIECKKALEEAEGDIKKAIEVLKKRGVAIAEKKASRATGQGRIEAYIHMGGKIGVLVEIDCETDFVANNDLFKQACKDIAMHIAAMAPEYLSEEDVPKEVLDQVEDKDEFLKEKVLLNQPFIKDESKTIKDYITDLISKTGENAVLKRFVRFEVGL